jgi:hypothetical protein
MVMMHKKMMLMAAAIAACTTQFERQGPTDGTTDTAVDTMADGTDTAAPDVGTDEPLPTWSVECTVDRTTLVSLLDTSFDVVCTDGGCTDANIYMGFDGEDLIAIAGGESREGLDGGWFFGAVVDVSGPGFEHGDAMNLPFPFPAEGWYTNVRNGSIVQRFPGVDLLYARYHQNYSSGTLDQELWSLRTSASGLNVDFDYQLVMDGVPNDERRRISYSRGVVAEGDLFLFLGMEDETTGGPSPIQLFGATVALGQYTGGSSWTYGVEFVPLQPDDTQIFFPNLPEAIGGTVVMPYLHLIISGTEGEYHSGLWVLDRPIPPRADIDTGTIDFQTDDSFEGSLAGSRIGPVTYAMAGLASNEPFTMEGMSPPYDLHVGVVTEPSPETGSVRGENVMSVSDSSMRNMDRFDFLDTKLLYNEALDVFHYVTILYPTDMNATVAIYTFDASGRPVMDPAPFVHDLGAFEVFGYDAVIQPGTGSIFFASYDVEDMSDKADAFSLVGITCALVEGP